MNSPDFRAKISALKTRIQNVVFSGMIWHLFKKYFPLFFLLVLSLRGQDLPVVPFFGVQTHFGQFYRPDMTQDNVDSMIALIKQAGIGLIRDECYWSLVETDSSVYNFPPEVDYYVQRCLENGIETLLILDYNNPLYAPQAGSGIADASNRQAFVNYCLAAVNHFSEMGIHLYEIWNEPNIPIFWDPSPSAEDYYLLLQLVYPAIKALDSSAIVLGCATSPAEGNPAPFIEGSDFIQQVFSLGGGNYMDGVSFHIYRVHQKPEDWIFEYTDLVQQIVGPEKQLYVTETGYHTASVWPYLTENQKASYLARLYLLGSSFPQLKLCSYYDLKDDGEIQSEPEHNFGLIEYDLSLKPSYNALKTVIEVMGNSDPDSTKEYEGLYQYYFSDPSTVSVALWRSQGSSNLNLRTLSPYYTLIQRDGQRTHYISGDSLIQVYITEKPLYYRFLPEPPAPFSFKIQPGNISIFPGESVQMSVKSYDSAGIPIQFSSEYISWSYLDDSGQIDDQGLFTALNPGNGYIIAEYETFADSVFISVLSPVHEYFLSNFDTSEIWGFGCLNLDSAYSGFNVLPFAADSENYVGKLDYRFVYSSQIGYTNYRAFLYRDITIPGFPDSMYISVYGNGNPHRLEFHFRDADDRPYSIFAVSQPADWNSSWGKIGIKLQNLPSGAVFPVSLEKITVYLIPAVFQDDSLFSGFIYLDSLKVIYESVSQIKKGRLLPHSSSLNIHVHPNPFNTGSLISFYIPRDSEVNIKIFDLRGRLIRETLMESRKAGWQTFTISGEGLSSGIYFVVIECGGLKGYRKITLLK